MGFDQYHEPPEEFSQEIRTFAHMITSLIEEAEAISWYEQRKSVEKDEDAKAIMANAQKEEFKHFGMNLESSSAPEGGLADRAPEHPVHEGQHCKVGEAAEKKAD